MNETMVSGDNNPVSDEWKNFDFSSAKTEKVRATRSLPKREIIQFATVGFSGGVLVWLMRLIIENQIMSPLFCQTPDTAAVCASANSTSFIISLIVISIIAAAILASQRMFRAIIITAAVAVCLGALWPLLDMRGAVSATFLTAFFATGLYLFFALIAAVKRNTLAMSLILVLTVAFWLLARA